jgi:hypothetical protein
MRAPREADLRDRWECRVCQISAKANVGIRESGQIGVELPGVREDGMSGKNAQRKLGTTRGSPRRSRTAKALRISRLAAKSRCACEWGGWGRLSDDGPGQNNPDPSEGPWGGGRPIHQAVHNRVLDPAQYGIIELTTRCKKGGSKPDVAWGMPGAGLSQQHPGKAPPEKPAFQPYWGKPAVRNDREDRGDVGIIRSPVRASILPDCGGRSAMSVPTATCARHGAWCESTVWSEWYPTDDLEVGVLYGPW